MCRVCGEEKNLIADFYKCRKDATKISSYAYECKECTLKRVKEYDKRVRKRYSLGTCDICEKTNVKIVEDLCKECNKLVEFNVDTLQRAVLYLQKNK